MIVVLSAAAPARLTDLDRLDRLHAECDGPPAAMRLDPLCVAHDDGEHVWLDVGAARAIGVAESGDDGFGDAFDAMIGFAARQGWLDEAGTHVRAHVESVA